MNDTRNIQDKYKWWDQLDIKEDLASSASGLHLVLLNLTGDFNVSSAIRSGNWFNVASVSIVGKRHIDTRGAVGAHHYMKISKHDDIFEVLAEHRSCGRRLVAAEIAERAVELPEYVWPYDVTLVLGEELRGVPSDVLEFCDDVVAIPGRGSVRSLNVASTATVFMYDYSNKIGLL